MILAPHDFIARLCALVPPPRFHLVRYAGTLAARAACRHEVVPGRPEPPPAQPSLFDDADLPPLAPPRPASRHLWSWLLRRVFTVEVDSGPEPACDGAMRLVHLAKTKRAADRRMVELGLAPRPPPGPPLPRREARPLTAAGAVPAEALHVGSLGDEAEVTLSRRTRRVRVRPARARPGRWAAPRAPAASSPPRFHLSR